MTTFYRVFEFLHPAFPDEDLILPPYSEQNCELSSV